MSFLYGDSFIHQFNALCFTHCPDISEINASNTLIQKLDEKSIIETIKFRQIADYLSSSKTHLKLENIFEIENHNNFRKGRSFIKINYGTYKNKISINQQEIESLNNKPYSSKSTHIKIGKFKISSNINNDDKNNIITLNSLYNYII